jgi:hypothetical protein
MHPTPTPCRILSRWHRLALACAALLPGLAAAGASAPALDPRPGLEAAQHALDAAYAGQRAACLQRWLVNRCLDQAAAAYRADSHALQQQMHAADLDARQRRAAAERARVARNLAQQPQAASAPRQRLLPHPLLPLLPASQGVRQTPQRRIKAPEPSSSQAAAAYADKLASYQRRQQQARQQGPAKPAASLPLPAARP